MNLLKVTRIPDIIHVPCVLLIIIISYFIATRRSDTLLETPVWPKFRSSRHTIRKIFDWERVIWGKAEFRLSKIVRSHKRIKLVSFVSLNFMLIKISCLVCLADRHVDDSNKKSNHNDWQLCDYFQDFKRSQYIVSMC